MSNFKSQIASMPRHSGKSALLIALASLALAGCGGKSGGGSSEGSTTAPKITTQPSGKSAALGGSVTFTVAAKSSADETYQWYKGNTKIDGATSASYTISSITSSDYGIYYVAVTNLYGTTVSSGATLSTPADGAPTITTQPNSTSAATGSSASFTVVASGSDLTYQWYKDDSIISGATSSTYTISSVKATSVGSYFVRVTNSVGSVDSSAATLSIASSSAPKISTQPQSKTVSIGSSAGFSVVASGSGLSYQWYKDGSAITGATSSTYTVSSATDSSAGGYYVIVTNSFGSVTSSTAVLTVASLPVITSQPTSQTINNGETATFSVVVTGSGLTYKWFKVSSSTTVSTSSTLSLTGSSTTAGTYKVTITNAAGSVTSDAFTLTVILPPTITSQPSNLTVGVGGTASFSVTADGKGASLSYQWFKNGTEISGATSSTFVINAAATSDAADYKVVVTNSAGNVTSNVATLTVDQPPTITTQPGSLTVNAGSSATFTVAATASGTITYQWYKNGAIIAGATSASYTIASAAESDEATYKVVVTNDGVASTTSNNATLTVN